jgi:hypothetical protein
MADASANVFADDGGRKKARVDLECSLQGETSNLFADGSSMGLDVHYDGECVRRSPAPSRPSPGQATNVPATPPENNATRSKTMCLIFGNDM